jgi:anion-transporting  ArsA/GET3 family ATPase
VGQVFGQQIGNTLTVISAVPGLTALEIDPQAAAYSIVPASLIRLEAFSRRCRPQH